MKTFEKSFVQFNSCSLNLALKIIVCILVAVYSTIRVAAQPSFNFQNAVRISGTDLQVNAQYRFSNITTGTDALVTITQFNGGAYLTELDGTSYGYAKAFQPVVHVPANSNGYVQFRIDFVNTGTTTAKSLTYVPMTLIDIDAATYGGEWIYEFDQIQANSNATISYETTTELNVNVSGGWATGINAPGTEYLGIDTLATGVMFTVENYYVSSLNIRVGANNNTNQYYDRLKSIYFKRFQYSNFLILKSIISNFKAITKEKAVGLIWELDANSDAKKVIVEKGDASLSFKQIGELMVEGKAGVNNIFRFDDNNLVNATNYYRLKIISVTGKATYSNVLLVRTYLENQNTLKIYPTLIKSFTTIAFKSEKPENAFFQITDYSGNVVYGQGIMLQKGNNTLQINNLANLKNGNYVASLKIGNQVYSLKIAK